jgi:hypothetical protein
MCNLKNSMIGGCVCGAALLCVLSGCGEGASGTVVGVENTAVTVAEPETFEQTTYRVSPDADISRDGEPASLLEIQPGDDVDVSVTTTDSGEEVATSVDASSEDEDDVDNDIDDDADLITPIDPDLPATDTTPAEAPAEPMTFEGRVASTLEGAMMIEHVDDQEMQIMVDEHAEVLVDGVAAEFSDILPGYEVMVVADEDYGQFHALRIEATSSTVVDPAPLEPAPEASEDPGTESDELPEAPTDEPLPEPQP